MNDIYMKLDTETGELNEIAGVMIELKPGDKLLTKNQNDYMIEKKRFIDAFGYFSSVLFNNQTVVKESGLLPNISDASLTRLIYTITFCKSDNSIMTVKQLKSQLGLASRTWYNFWNEMQNNNILYEKDQMVYISSDVCKTNNLKENSKYVRVFHQYVRALYEQCKTPEEHKPLSYLFRIMPFISPNNGLLCLNPLSNNPEPMSMDKLCEIIKYDKHNIRALAYRLESIKVGGLSPIWFVHQKVNIEDWYVVVNPKMCYRGSYKQIDNVLNEFIEVTKTLRVEEI